MSKQGTCRIEYGSDTRVQTDGNMRDSLEKGHTGRESMSTQTTSVTSLGAAACHELRHDWKRTEVAAIYRTPLPELIFRAQSLHRQFHEPDRVQTCQLISIKTGGGPGGCADLPQRAHYDTGGRRERALGPTHRHRGGPRGAQTGACRVLIGGAGRAAPETQGV